MKNLLQSEKARNELVNAIKADIKNIVRQRVGDMAVGHILEMETNFFGETRGEPDNIQLNISLGIFGDAELLAEEKELQYLTEPHEYYEKWGSEPPMTWERVVDEIPGINN